jgi:cellulose synthase/poly-beta-1,6-N-acetylglucosamine synthase-like glycosyltransferase
MSASTLRWSVGVVVPAKNEARKIERCLASIFRSADAIGYRDCLWIVVVADHCRDATVSIARQAVGRHGEVMECEVCSAGSARRLGTEAALAHFAARHRTRIWLANTDADSHVSEDWLQVQLQLADVGVTGVAGIVQLDADGTPEAQQLHRETYRLGADGSHPHVHGANVAMRADAYLDVGGWRDMALAEEHCLWNRLRHGGWRVASPVSSIVTTSGRLRGRARGGFADTLRTAIAANRARS